MRSSPVTSVGEADVILTCDKPTEEASALKPWKENYRAYLATKESKAWRGSGKVQVLMRPGGGSDRGHA